MNTFITAAISTFLHQYFSLFSFLFSVFLHFRFVFASIFTLTFKFQLARARAGGVGRLGGRLGSGRNPCQLKFDILKDFLRGMKSSENDRKTIRNGPQTIRTIRKRCKPSENDLKTTRNDPNRFVEGHWSTCAN